MAEPIMADPVTQQTSFSLNRFADNANQDAARRLQAQIEFLRAKTQKDITDLELKSRADLQQSQQAAMSDEAIKAREFAQQQQEAAFAEQLKLREIDNAAAEKVQKRLLDLQQLDHENEAALLSAPEELRQQFLEKRKQINEQRTLLETAIANAENRYKVATGQADSLIKILDDGTIDGFIDQAETLRNGAAEAVRAGLSQVIRETLATAGESKDRWLPAITGGTDAFTSADAVTEDAASRAVGTAVADYLARQAGFEGKSGQIGGALTDMLEAFRVVQGSSRMPDPADRRAALETFHKSVGALLRAGMDENTVMGVMRALDDVGSGVGLKTMVAALRKDVSSGKKGSYDEMGGDDIRAFEAVFRQYKDSEGWVRKALEANGRQPVNIKAVRDSLTEARRMVSSGKTPDEVESAFKESGGAYTPDEREAVSILRRATKGLDPDFFTAARRKKMAADEIAATKRKLAENIAAQTNLEAETTVGVGRAQAKARSETVRKRRQFLDNMR